MTKMELNRLNGTLCLKESKNNSQTSHQIIYYGVPGTGKSYKIKKYLEDNNVDEKNIFRTAFYPDSDYSTFVGAYKSTMNNHVKRTYSKYELISKLKKMINNEVKYAPHKFSAKYWRSIKQLSTNDKKEILRACELSDHYSTEFSKGAAIGQEYLAYPGDLQIIYSFVPQTFLSAYMRAYETKENVYLVIEDIDRGNCAQIFGDLFQLLDRDDDGKSVYTTKADTDIRAYLEDRLGKGHEGIKNGELRLPSNLYIFATMGTSDQSLFPIDSAFKRRWAWEYQPIRYNNTKWTITIGNKEFSWVSFQKVVNKRIFDATHREDKMLGDYFVNPRDGNITEQEFLNKVVYYLWNDVCKDGEVEIFRISETKELPFSELYSDEGRQKIIEIMDSIEKEQST